MRQHAIINSFTTSKQANNETQQTAGNTKQKKNKQKKNDTKEFKTFVTMANPRYKILQKLKKKEILQIYSKLIFHKIKLKMNH